MRARWPVAALFVAALSWSGPAVAENLQSSGGFLFDVQGGGDLSNGTIDAYDSCYRLQVGGGSYSGAASLDGRTVRLSKAALGGLQVSRSIYVPDAAGQDWARYVDVFENPGDEPVTAEVTIAGNLGSDGSTVAWYTSSGDEVVTAEDSWFGTDDSDGVGDPTLAHLFFGEGAPLRPHLVQLSGDDLEVRFRVTVEPGQATALMYFAFQGPNQAEVRRQVEAVLGDLNGAMAGLEPFERDRIMNWPGFGFPSLVGIYEVEGGARPEEPGSTGVLHLASRDVPGAIERAVELAESLGGHLESQSDLGLVVRVPDEDFVASFERFAALGDVLSRRLRIRRAPERAENLRIRLRSARDTRARLQALADRAPTTVEALAIQREIERLNMLDERLTLALEDVEDRVRFARVQIQFRPTHRPTVRPIPNDLFRLPFPWLEELGLQNLMNVR